MPVSTSTQISDPVKAGIRALLYRTSVFNNFDSIVKAYIYVLEMGSATIVESIAGLDYSFSVKEILPFQVNPTNIEFNRPIKKAIENEEQLELLALKGNIPNPGSDEKDEDKEFLTCSFFCDSFDENQARTFEGTLPVNGACVFDEDYVIIEKLREYAGISGYRVVFKWGPIEYYGFLRSVDVVYSKYTIYGEPTHAVVNLHISQASLGRDEKTNLEKRLGLSTLGSAWTIIKGFSLAETAATVAAKVVEEATALAAPSILRTANRG
jgi:hypothetical protein